MKLNQKKQRFNLTPNRNLLLATSLVLFGCTQVQAEPLNSSGNQTAAPLPSVVFAAPSIPPNTGRPDGRREAGGRGCRNQNAEASVAVPEEPTEATTAAEAEKKHLTALVPSIPSAQFQGAEFVGGLTTTEHPTFWFYTPYQPPFIG